MTEQIARDNIGDARRKFGNCFTWKYRKKPTPLIERRKNHVKLEKMKIYNKEQKEKKGNKWVNKTYRTKLAWTNALKET